MRADSREARRGSGLPQTSLSLKFCRESEVFWVEEYQGLEEVEVLLPAALEKRRVGSSLGRLWVGDFESDWDCLEGAGAGMREMLPAWSWRGASLSFPRTRDWVLLFSVELSSFA